MNWWDRCQEKEGLARDGVCGDRKEKPEMRNVRILKTETEFWQTLRPQSMYKEAIKDDSQVFVWETQWLGNLLK